MSKLNVTQQEEDRPPGETCKKRKVSCLSCRQRKVKCDGNQPCGRCMDKGIGCNYVKPGQVGRPAKNAVINKLVRAQQSNHLLIGNNFIFEHISSITTASTSHRNAVFMFDDKTITLPDFMSDVFSAFFGPKNTAAAIILRPPPSVNPREVVNSVRVYDMLPYFAWTTSDIVKTVVHRISRLPLPRFSRSYGMLCGMILDTSSEFFEPIKKDNMLPRKNPLKSLTHAQALELLECFFCLHPFSHFFNKTTLLQAYWTDTLDPFLLSVIYGSTTYFCRLFQGVPLVFYETTLSGRRNVFLDYAYYMLTKTSAEATLSRYQGLVVLGLFEGAFGYARRSIAIFATAHLMAVRLGVFSKDIPQNMTDVDRECLLTTFWTAYTATVTGCISLDQLPREAFFLPQQPPFPPPTALASVSFQHDVSHGQQRSFNKHYPCFVESFYIEVVIARFSARIYEYLPEPKYNFFRTGLQNRSPPIHNNNNNTKGGVVMIKPEDAAKGIARILESFRLFIEENRKYWAVQQVHLIESTWLVYSIHAKFLRRRTLKSVHDDRSENREVGVAATAAEYVVDPEKEKEDLMQMYSAVPLAVELLEKMEGFCYESLPDHIPVAMLCQGLLLTCLETSAHVLMLKYWRDPWDIASWLHLQRLQALLMHPTIWSDWSQVEETKRWLAAFFDEHPEPPSLLLSGPNLLLDSMDGCSPSLITDNPVVSEEEPVQDVLNNDVDWLFGNNNNNSKTTDLLMSSNLVPTGSEIDQTDVSLLLNDSYMFDLPVQQPQQQQQQPAFIDEWLSVEDDLFFGT